MSWWNLSRCSSLTSPRFSGKKIHLGLQKVDFQTHIASYSFVRSQQVLYNKMIDRCFLIFWEVLASPINRQPCISFSLNQVFIEMFVLHQFPGLWPFKYTSFIFASLNFGNLFLIYSNPRPVLSIIFTMFFVRSRFMCKRAEKFSPEEQEEDWRHFSPLASVMFV